MINKIQKSIIKFNLDLKDKVVLTEAATGNFAVTPILAAYAGAKVYAFTKQSKYGSIENVKKETFNLAKKLHIDHRIKIITDLAEVDLSEIDILTNTGFLRPINEKLIQQLSDKCVIPLMWEPWEFREDELDIEACTEKEIKVYGTNESDDRLKTMEYLGYIALYKLLEHKITPFSGNILILGSGKFLSAIHETLELNNYKNKTISEYSEKIDINHYNAIIVCEHSSNLLLIGEDNAFIQTKQINSNSYVLHISGNVNFDNAKFRHSPDKPAKFGYMSYTSDFIDSMAVIDLHTAGLKVAEGMLKANCMKLTGEKYKTYMEKNYPALSFDNPEYW